MRPPDHHASSRAESSLGQLPIIWRTSVRCLCAPREFSWNKYYSPQPLLGQVLASCIQLREAWCCWKQSTLPPPPPPPKSVHLSQMNVLVEAVVCQALFFNLLQLLIAPLIFLPSRQSVLKKCDFRFCGWVGKLGFPGWRSVNPTACTSLGLKVFERTRTASWAQGGGCEGYSWGQRPWFTDPCSWVTVLEHKVPLVRILVIHKLPKSEGI